MFRFNNCETPCQADIIKSPNSEIQLHKCGNVVIESQQIDAIIREDEDYVTVVIDNLKFLQKLSS